MKAWSGLILLVRKAAAAVAIAVVFSIVPAGAPQAVAAPAASRFIAIVYDDSGSMRVDDAGKRINNYIYANYSLQNMAALMEPQDSARVYLISRKGTNPIDVRRQRDLYQAMKGIGAAPKGDTYAETLHMAMKDGAAFLKSNQNGELLFVLVTDGASMYDEKGDEIKGSLKQVFGRYLDSSGVSAYPERCRALLLSVGSDRPLSPVSDLRAVLEQTGIPTSVFTADVTDGATAGKNIMDSMTDLAEAMASTNLMVLEPGKPFTLRYPLESLAVMEQFQQSSESTIKSIEGGGVKLRRETLYSTKAIGGVKLASTFSSVKAEKGSIKPGQYTIQTNGDTKLMAFSKVGFGTAVSLHDGSGKEVAAYASGRWSVKSVSLPVGSRLTAKVSLLALDGSPVGVDSHVKVSFGQTPNLNCETTGVGAFQIDALKPGRDYLAVTLEDPEFFQIALPALPIDVPMPADSSATPGATASPAATATINGGDPQNTAPGTGHEVLDGQDVHDTRYRVLAAPYTSSADYIKAGGISLGGKKPGEAAVSFRGIPDGMQLRWNGKVFDAANPAGTVTIAGDNTLELWVDRSFSVSGRQTIDGTVGDGQPLAFNYEAVPRPVKIELSPGELSLNVMDGAGSAGYRVFMMENGQWQELAPSAIAGMQLAAPGGFAAQLDTVAHAVRVGPAWLPALTPVGAHGLVLTAGTGKPGETASATLQVTVLDDWRKWIAPGAGLAAVLLLIAYALKLAAKKRITLKMEAYAADNPGFTNAKIVPVGRCRLKRALWPFGRETCVVGPLELYPHPHEADKVLLSNIAVQYGLTLDGKPPQFHKERDEAGDFALNSGTVVGVRLDGRQQYYRFLCPPVIKKKPKAGLPRRKK